MLKRLLLGLLIGLIMGGLVAAGLVKGLGMTIWNGAPLAYLFAALTGALVGLVAGKPIWASGGQIEAGLKAIFGALITAGGMYAVRTWLGVQVDLRSIGAGIGVVGNLPAVSLPLLSALLGALYGLDNTPATEGDDAGKNGKKATTAGAPSKDNGALAKGKQRVAAEDVEGGDEDLDLAPAKKGKS